MREIMTASSSSSLYHCDRSFCDFLTRQEMFPQRSRVFHHLKEFHLGLGLERHLLECPFCDVDIRCV